MTTNCMVGQCGMGLCLAAVLGLAATVLAEPIARTVERVGDPRPSERLTGLWQGVYHYPEGSGQESVKFTVMFLYDGKTVVGYMKEPNTFGLQNEPWLHAACKGTLDTASGKLTVTKTYDGSAGVSHSVEYSGVLSMDRKKVEGSWTIGEFVGRFVLDRQALDDAALEALK